MARRHDRLPLPSIMCPWCSYKDKCAEDLQWHFLDHHKSQLYQFDSFYFLYEMEKLLCVVIELAKQQSGIKVKD